MNKEIEEYWDKVANNWIEKINKEEIPRAIKKK